MNAGLGGVMGAYNSPARNRCDCFFSLPDRLGLGAVGESIVLVVCVVVWDMWGGKQERDAMAGRVSGPLGGE